MSDIQKLNKIIDTLEEQSAQVTEFSGVLSAVHASKVEISLARVAFEELLEEQEKLVSVSFTRHNEYRDKLVAFESKLSQIERNVVTAAQFEAAKDKILLRISELRFVTSEQFEQRTNKSETHITTQIAQANSNLEGVIAAQENAIRSLRTFVVIGMLVLALGIAYLARDIFL